MCKIEGCWGKPVAQGLCAKHYMRLRRHGNATETHKPGPKPSRLNVAFRALMADSELSPRTLARHAKAYRLLAGLIDDETMKQVLKAVTRPSGSLNASKLLAIAIALAEEDGDE